jgi:hypothetical protein
MWGWGRRREAAAADPDGHARGIVERYLIAHPDCDEHHHGYDDRHSFHYAHAVFRPPSVSVVQAEWSVELRRHGLFVHPDDDSDNDHDEDPHAHRNGDSLHHPHAVF